jgi:hypothetical protein
MTSDTRNNDGLPVRLELKSGVAADQRWLDQVTQLVEDLSRDVGDVRVERIPEASSKGGADVIILALGSAGAFTALVDVLRLWLGRDHERAVTMTWDEGGRSRRVTVQADSIDNATLRELALAAARRRSI